MIDDDHIEDPPTFLISPSLSFSSASSLLPVPEVAINVVDLSMDHHDNNNNDDVVDDVGGEDLVSSIWESTIMGDCEDGDDEDVHNISSSTSQLIRETNAAVADETRNHRLKDDSFWLQHQQDNVHHANSSLNLATEEIYDEDSYYEQQVLHNSLVDDDETIAASCSISSSGRCRPHEKSPTPSSRRRHYHHTTQKDSSSKSTSQSSLFRLVDEQLDMNRFLCGKATDAVMNRCATTDTTTHSRRTATATTASPIRRRQQQEARNTATATPLLKSSQRRAAASSVVVTPSPCDPPVDHHRKHDHQYNHYNRSPPSLASTDDADSSYAATSISSYSNIYKNTTTTSIHHNHHTRNKKSCNIQGEATPSRSTQYPDSTATRSCSHNRTNNSNKCTQHLHWRMDPKSSLSDWDLQIFNRTSKKFITYHVHRVVLAIGPTSCGYFQTIFEGKNNINAEHTEDTLPSRNNDKNMTRIPLIAGACDYLPNFLDFVYGSQTPKFRITRDSCLALMFLSIKFEQPKLEEMTLRYFIEDLETNPYDTLQTYYEDSIYYFGDDHGSTDYDVLQHVLFVASQVLLENQDDILDFLEYLSSDHFIEILDNMTDADHNNLNSSFLMENRHQNQDQQLQQEPSKHKRRSNTKVIASLIADYCILHQEELSLSIFERMTDRLTDRLLLAANEKLQNKSIAMDARAAVVLMQMDLIFRNESQLQKQCFHVLIEDWESLLVDLEPQTLKELLVSLSNNKPIMMMEWFYTTLQKVYTELVRTRQDCSRNKKYATKVVNAAVDDEVSNDALREDLNCVVDELDHVNGELGRMQTRFSSAKEEMKGQVQGWIRKHNQVDMDRQLEQERFAQERQRWDEERTKLLEEKELLESELKQYRNRENARKNGPYLADNATCSTISEMSSWEEGKETSPSSPEGGGPPAMIPHPIMTLANATPNSPRFSDCTLESIFRREADRYLPMDSIQ